MKAQAVPTLADELAAVWGRVGSADTLYIPLHTFIYLRRPFMTKRGFRRWRAKVRKWQ